MSTNPLPKLEDCKPGFRPTEYNVVVTTSEKAMTSTSGKIIIPETVGEKEALAQMRGLLVAVSPHAFNYEADWPEGSKPKPGDVVLFAKFAGVVPQEKAPDGREYRVIKDRDLVAVFEESADV